METLQMLFGVRHTIICLPKERKNTSHERICLRDFFFFREHFYLLYFISIRNSSRSSGRNDFNLEHFHCSYQCAKRNRSKIVFMPALNRDSEMVNPGEPRKGAQDKANLAEDPKCYHNIKFVDFQRAVILISV